MSRIRISRQILLLGVIVMLSVTACTAAPQSATVAPATPKSSTVTALDIKSVLRGFLANLPEDWNLIASSDLKPNATIVDVRQPDEYAKGFIAGAINIPLRGLAQNLRALPKLDQEIVVVCNSGHRAAIGMMVLQMLGYKNAKSLAGGMVAWQAAKQPVVTAPVPPRPTGQAPQVNAQLVTALDYYLEHTLPYDWGIIDTKGLTADQKLLPSSAGDAMPETYDQGASLLVDVDTPVEFQASPIATYQKAINLPLRQLPDALDQMPLQETIDWA